MTYQEALERAQNFIDDHDGEVETCDVVEFLMETYDCEKELAYEVAEELLA